MLAGACTALPFPACRVGGALRPACRRVNTSETDLPPSDDRGRLIASPFGGQAMQSLADIPESAAVVISGLPDRTLVLRKRRPVGRGQVIEAVKLRINGVIPDERPLLKKSLEVNRVLLPIALVHQQQRVQAFHLHPPFLVRSFRFA